MATQARRIASATALTLGSLAFLAWIAFRIVRADIPGWAEIVLLAAAAIALTVGGSPPARDSAGAVPAPSAAAEGARGVPSEHRLAETMGRFVVWTALAALLYLLVDTVLS